MKLKDHIKQSIKQYPILFKAENYKTSEMLVLNHLFLVIGNGYEWHDGYLCKDDELKPYGEKKFKSLPKGFFKKREHTHKKTTKSMYEFRKKHLNIMKKKFFDIVKKGNYYYFRYPKDRVGCKFSPYPICKYSRFTMIPDDVRPDWLKGAIKVVKATLDYYNDPQKYKTYFDYPHKDRISKLKYDFEKLTKEGRFKEVAVKLWGAKPEDETKPEQYAKRFWKKHKKEQIAYLKKFLMKYNVGETK